MPHGGDLVAEILRKHGVTQVFGQPGGQTAAFYQGLSNRKDMSHLGCRDERSAAYAADAYARVSGKPGIVDVTVGPGTTKLPDGLIESMNASVPIVAIVGELPRSWVPLRDGGVGSQGFDQMPFLQTMTKQSWLAPDLETVPDLVRAAFRTATTGKPGPTAVVIPHDVLDEEWEETDLEVEERFNSAPAYRSRPSDDELRTAAALIAKAERPYIIAGGGVLGSSATAELAEFATRVGAAVGTSFTGKGSVTETESYSVGVLNPLGSQAARELAGEADLIIWLGSKVGQNTSLNWALPKPEQMTIQVDVDGSQLGRTFGPSSGLLGDVKATLEALIPLVEPKSVPQWQNRIAESKTAAWASTEPLRLSEASPVMPPRAMTELAKHLRPHDIVVSDASFSAGWISNYLKNPVPGRNFLFARGQGGLGYSTPASMGAAKARPEARIVTVSGDGGFSYSVGELATQAAHGMNIVHVVLNNGTWGWLRMWEHLHYEGLRYSVDLESEKASTSYAAAAAGLGMQGILVTSADELASAFDKAFSTEGPTVVEIRIDPDATPIDSYTRRLASGKFYPRPGTVYQARPWRQSAGRK